MLQLPDGKMAVGTASGIFIIDPDSEVVEELNYFLPGGSQVSKYVCTLYLHGEDELWIGTDGGGVYVYSLSSGAVLRNLSTAEGLPSSTISSICKDAYNRILIATDAGLAYVDSDLSDKVIDVNYGFNIDCEYVGGAVVNMHNGQILYGTTTGALINRWYGKMNATLLSISMGIGGFGGTVGSILVGRSYVERQA